MDFNKIQCFCSHNALSSFMYTQKTPTRKSTKEQNDAPSPTGRVSVGKPAAGRGYSARDWSRSATMAASSWGGGRWAVGLYLFLGEFWRVVIFVIDHDGRRGCAC